MKTIEWKFIDGAKDLDESYIGDFMEKQSKKSNCWWSKLPAMLNGWKSYEAFYAWFIKEHIKHTPEGAPLEIPTVSLQTAKTCPAIGKGLLDKTYLLKTPVDIQFYIDSQGKVVVQPFSDLIKVSSHSTQQFHINENNPFERMINFKFELPIIIDTKGLSYMFLQPQFHKQKYPFQVVNGVIEGDYTRRMSLNINTVFKVPEEGEQTFFIRRGTVLSYLWLPEQTKLKHSETMQKRIQTGWFGNDRTK